MVSSLALLLAHAACATVLKQLDKPPDLVKDPLVETRRVKWCALSTMLLPP